VPRGGEIERRLCVVATALATAFLAVAAPAAAQEAPAGPGVRMLSRLSAADGSRLADDTLAARMAAVSRGPDGVPVASVVLRLRGADVSSLERLGARLGTREGTLVTARVPLAALGAVLADGAVAGVYGARRWPPYNDLGTADIGVASLRHAVAADSFTGAIGRGVIVGLVDTGVDYRHPDFLIDATQQSRILFLWDQTSSGGPAPGTVGTTPFTYGTECTRAQLSAGQCASTDVVGHGTHVLGTAAGDGSGTGNGLPAGQFAGVAPGADLIVVKTTFYSSDVVDGVNYIFSRAAQLGRPAVVNLSLGAQWGPHDGTLPEEEELDSLEGPGRIVVAAVGNSGDNRNTTAPPPAPTDRVHAEAAVPAPGQQVDFALTVPAYAPAPGNNNDFLVPQLWYAASDTVAITVIRPDGSTVSSGPTGSATVTEDSAGGQIIIANGPATGVALTPDHLGFVVLGDYAGTNPPAPGVWTIRVTGVAAHSGRPMHLWLSEGTLGTTGDITGVTFGPRSANSYLIGTPATATRVIAAAAYTTRLRWQDVDGQTEAYVAPPRLGDLAAFSAPGPRRDGVLKPDLSAPGQGIASTLSSAAPVPRERIVADNRHWILEGTSMAAPFVTGAVALLLERNPRLTPEAARALLVGAARADSFTTHPYDGGPDLSPNASWGYGKLDVPGALNALTTALLGPGGRINLSENPVRGPFVVIHYAGVAARVGIYTFTGALVREFVSPPAGRVQWDLTDAAGRPVVNGVYIVAVDPGGGSMVERRRIYVARRRAP
jgi:subtilisin family serine protease